MMKMMKKFLFNFMFRNNLEKVCGKILLYSRIGGEKITTTKNQFMQNYNNKFSPPRIFSSLF